MLYASTKLHTLASQIIVIIKLKIVAGGSVVVDPGVIAQRAAKWIFLIFLALNKFQIIEPNNMKFNKWDFFFLIHSFC